jgi:4-hydroxythreonine-4-phosphate dehydrogenase
LPAAAGLSGNASEPRFELAGPILAVVGSQSTASRRQADVLQGAARLAAFAPAVEILRGGESHPLWPALRDEVDRALSAGRDVLIRIGGDGRDDPAGGHALCESLGRLLGAAGRHVGALVATGGETARALLVALGAHGLRLLRELEPGIPLSVALGRQPIPVVTKAGAFGSAESLLHCYRELAATRRRDAADTADWDLS